MSNDSNRNSVSSPMGFIRNVLDRGIISRVTESRINEPVMPKASVQTFSIGQRKINEEGYVVYEIESDDVYISAPSLQADFDEEPELILAEPNVFIGKVEEEQTVSIEQGIREVVEEIIPEQSADLFTNAIKKDICEDIDVHAVILKESTKKPEFAVNIQEQVEPIMVERISAVSPAPDMLSSDMCVQSESAYTSAEAVALVQSAVVDYPSEMPQYEVSSESAIEFDSIEAQEIAVSVEPAVYDLDSNEEVMCLIIPKLTIADEISWGHEESVNYNDGMESYDAVFKARP